jgi:hypothetical protein
MSRSHECNAARMCACATSTAENLNAGVKWSIKGLDKGSGPFKINFI